MVLKVKADGAEYFVDPSIDADSGSGTVGDPYGDLQYALDQTSRNSNGEIFWIKAGTAEALTGTIDLTTRTEPSVLAPIAFAGYTSAANDGGIGSIDAGTGSLFDVAAHTNPRGIFFVNLDLHGAIVADHLIDLHHWSAFINCHIYRTGNPTEADVLIAGSSVAMINCLATDGRYDFAGNSIITDSVFLARDQISEFPAFNCRTGNVSFMDRCISVVHGSNYTGVGFSLPYYCNFFNCSVYAETGQDGAGFDHQSNHHTQSLMNSLVQGFDGTGGDGYAAGACTGLQFFCGNGAYDNATNYENSSLNLPDHECCISDDNEDNSAALFNAPGSDDFAPEDTGNLARGAWPTDAPGRGW